MNPVLLQKQLKENASDLQDFCRDLQSWGEEMKRKDNSLKNEKSIKKTKTKQVKSITTKKETKIGPTDYSKWEKFNADLECENLNDDIKDDSELTDEFEESIRDEALVYKQKGNSYVKNKEWDKAIECYTKAINCYCYDPVFFANRALCHLKKQNYTAAEEDSTFALRLDKNYVKALQRRAAARENLGKLELAKSDLESVLVHEPKNKESLASLEIIKNKLGLEETVNVPSNYQRPVSKFTASRNKTNFIKPTPTITTSKIEKEALVDNVRIDSSVPSTSDWPDPGCEIIPVKAIDKPPHMRSKKALKHIDIVEVDSCSKPESKMSLPVDIMENSAVKKHVIEKVREVSLSENDEAVAGHIQLTSAFKKNKQLIKNDTDGKLSSTSWPKPNHHNINVSSDDLKILEKLPETEKMKDVKNHENLIVTKNYKAKKDCTLQAGDVIDDFLVPKTSVQFYATWKGLKTQEERYKYLRKIDPNQLANLFQHSLESNVFSSILSVLSTCFIEKQDDVYEYLLGLTQVKRFAALTMFMSSTDKNCTWKIISYLRDQKNIPKEDVDNLVSKYEL